MKDYSIVIPVYYNKGSLEPVMTSIYNDVILHNPALSCEVIFVDDGSGDDSLEELLRIRDAFPDYVKIIALTRNFGQINAMLAGFTHTRGRCVISMSADGQDPPSLINEMLKAHYEEGYDVAICTREGRDESFYRVITSRFFYSLIKNLTFPNMPEGGFDFVLFGERAMKTYLQNLDVNPFYQGGILWMGYKTKFIKYFRKQRISGQSRWTFAKKLTFLIDGVMAYSFFPIRFISYAGLLISLLGFLYALIVFIAKLIWGNPVVGWAPIMIVILVMGGFQILMLGMIGEYLWRTLSQVRRRDFYVIDKIYDQPSNNKNRTSI